MRIKILGVAVAAAVLATAGPAVAASKPAKPGASTGAVTAVTQTGATVTGTVNPQGQAASYYFQYGTTAAYGSQTGPVSAGNGTAAVKASTLLTGLAVATTYHYRVVATNPTGTTIGADKTFATKKQPLGLSLAASPNPAPFGGSVTLSGTLTGTDSAGHAVVLQQRAFPYTAGWANVGNQQLTTSAGAFSFAVLSLTANTQFHVVTTGSDATSSPIVIAGSAALVHVAVTTKTPKAGTMVRFAGTVHPREDGALYAIQKQRGNTWVTVAGSSLGQYSADASRYAIRVRIAHSGTYRVYVGIADGAHVSSASPGVTFKVRPSH